MGVRSNDGCWELMTGVRSNGGVLVVMMGC